jgi:hypothetical protein
MFSIQSNMRRHAHTHLQAGSEVACESEGNEEGKGDEESEEAPVCTRNIAVYTPVPCGATV